ncbi:hypothetical protein BST13_17215 [Mycobacterium aquaticum]|uniref:DUF1275 family protein n=2 Tax=Mycobacterium aquaticum TaxID=1927124 RepID=A0A1X0AWQ7_9MYCO|nr:hypothetical protein BST13_17215 [Mycobacterium aquaticum]
MASSKSAILVRNSAAMALAATSGGADAIGYLALGHVFTSAMTGNLTLLGIGMAHRDGLRIGRVFVSLVCYMAGATVGARIVGAAEPGDAVWPPAVTRALTVETIVFVTYAIGWWAMGPRPAVYSEAILLGIGATGLGIQSSAMQRFGSRLGLNTTFLSGSLVRLVGQLATGHRYRDIHHHLLVLVGLVCGGSLGALLVLRAPTFAPLVPLAGLAFALCAALWQARGANRMAKENYAHAVSPA